MLERLLGRFKKDTVLPQDRIRTANLNSEIRQCLEYFDQKSGATHVTSVHGNGITIGRLDGNEKQYFWEKNGLVKQVGKDNVTDDELANIIKRIHHITFPYRDYIGKQREKHT